jgi:DNA repair photolyase
LLVYEDATRSVLARNDSPDLGFRWSVNPYRGCYHGCAYCYARPSHERLGFGSGTDFERRLVVKQRVAELLRAELCKPSWRSELILLSGNTDCYQPLEAAYRLTRACLQVCLEARNPVHVITKAPLVERDVDLLAALASRGAASVSISVPFFDPVLARAIEPGVATPARRFRTIRRLAEAGVPVGVNVAPVIPGLTDDQIPRILEASAEAGASTASMILLRLPGNVESVFLERMRSVFPERLDRVTARLREARGGVLDDARFGSRMRGKGPYAQEIVPSCSLRSRSRPRRPRHARTRTRS